MKHTLFLKPTIGPLEIFVILVAGLVFWKPLNSQYYEYCKGLEHKETHVVAVKYLLEADKAEAVRYYYEPRYASKDVNERLAVVDELCAAGDKGKELMYDLFRERCKSEMILIPAGSFMMGSDNGLADEKPVHQVTLSAFWMDKYEVTNEKYYVFVKCTNYRQPGIWQHGRIPIGEQLILFIVFTGMMRMHMPNGCICVCQRRRNGSTHAVQVLILNIVSGTTNWS